MICDDCGDTVHSEEEAENHECNVDEEEYRPDDAHRVMMDVFHDRTDRDEKKWERFQHAANILATAALRAQRASDFNELDEAIEEDVYEKIKENLDSEPSKQKDGDSCEQC